MWPFLWTTLARSAPSVLVGAGVDASNNDPFEKNFGGRASLGVEWRPWLQTRASFVGYPLRGTARFSALTKTLIDANFVAPDLSYQTARVQVGAAFPALRAHSGGLTGSVGPEIGVGFVHTVDHLQLICMEDDPEAQADEREWHPTVSFGFVGEISSLAHGLEHWLPHTPVTGARSGCTCCSPRWPQDGCMTATVQRRVSPRWRQDRTPPTWRPTWTLVPPGSPWPRALRPSPPAERATPPLPLASTRGSVVRDGAGTAQDGAEVAAGERHRHLVPVHLVDG